MLARNPNVASRVDGLVLSYYEDNSVAKVITLCQNIRSLRLTPKPHWRNEPSHFGDAMMETMKTSCRKLEAFEFIDRKNTEYSRFQDLVGEWPALHTLVLACATRVILDPEQYPSSFSAKAYRHIEVHHPDIGSLNILLLSSFQSLQHLALRIEQTHQCPRADLLALLQGLTSLVYLGIIDNH
ncbi:hypothetical protein P7C70_g6041, partial [Phenoliferia sp. Uapishka_3]